MGEWDYYCFLCATTFITSSALPDPDADEEDDEKDTTANVTNIELTPNDVAWLDAFRVIGENAAAPSLRRCFLSGRAEVDSFGRANVEKGIDPVAPGESEDDQVDTGMYRDWDADEEVGALPVHDCCLRILQRTAVSKAFIKGAAVDMSDREFGFDLGRADGDLSDAEIVGDEMAELETVVSHLVRAEGVNQRMDPDALFHCLSSKREEYQCSLTIDYGAMNDMASEQYFYVEKGKEPYVLDPYDIPQMQRLSSALPLLDSSSDSFNQMVTGTDFRQTSPSDPFSRLSLELLTMIFLELPQETLPNAILSSRSLNRICSDNFFWQRRLEMDMPWAWEVLESKQNIDFHQAYIRLGNLVKDPLRSEIPALANRKRVWYASEQVLELYREYRISNPPTNAGSDISSSVMQREAKLERFPYVATSRTSSKKVTTMWLPIGEGHIHSEKKLVLSWSNGSLAGLECIVGTQSTSVGNTTDIDQSDDMIIGKDDWIQGLIFHINTVKVQNDKNHDQIEEASLVVGVTVQLLSGSRWTLGQAVGYKRLFMPQRGKGIVGINVELKGPIITRFGILEYAHSRINQMRDLGDPSVLSHLWASALPTSPGLVFKEAAVGYWGMTGHRDLVPFSCLMFETAGSYGLDSVTGISGSHDARSWKLHRRTIYLKESVGPEQADAKMRFFSVDGSSGERIVGIETNVGPYISGVRIITNRARQCAWGKTYNSTTRYHAEPGSHITGIYCSHGYHSVRAELTTFSIITTPDSHIWDSPAPVPDFEALKDMHGLLWEPSLPPSNYTETSSTYYGNSAQGERAVFLDFGRAVAKVTGLLAAAPDTRTELLGGFSIIYADGDVVFCGGTTAAEDLHDRTPPGMSIGGPLPDQKELEALEIPHVVNEQEARAQPTEFEANGERIQKINVWAGAYLHGIQFVTESGKESPKWGKCGGSVSAVVVAGSLVDNTMQAEEVGHGGEAGKKMRVVGLKIVLGSIRFNRSYPEVRPLAVQVMGVTEEDNPT